MSIYFWSHREENGYLSNFFPSRFMSDGHVFNCNEQYFMWRKLKLFDPGNIELERRLLMETNPAIMKAIGRKIGGYDDSVWSHERYRAMLDGLRLKFSQNEELKRLLLKTGDAMLYEASPWDSIWGIGLNAKVAQRISPDDYPGTNLLGKALMELREELMK